MTVWQFLVVLYAAFTFYGVKTVFQLRGGIEKLVNRSITTPGESSHILVALFTLLATAWWLGLMMLFSVSREAMAREVLKKLKKNPDNAITSAEEGAILRYIDEFKEK